MKKLLTLVKTIVDYIDSIKEKCEMVESSK